MTVGLTVDGKASTPIRLGSTFYSAADVHSAADVRLPLRSLVPAVLAKQAWIEVRVHGGDQRTMSVHTAKYPHHQLLVSQHDSGVRVGLVRETAGGQFAERPDFAMGGATSIEILTRAQPKAPSIGPQLTLVWNKKRITVAAESFAKLPITSWRAGKASQSEDKLVAAWRLRDVLSTVGEMANVSEVAIQGAKSSTLRIIDAAELRANRVLVRPVDGGFHLKGVSATGETLWRAKHARRLVIRKKPRQ